MYAAKVGRSSAQRSNPGWLPVGEATNSIAEPSAKDSPEVSTTAVGISVLFSALSEVAFILTTSAEVRAGNGNRSVAAQNTRGNCDHSSLKTLDLELIKL